MNPYYIIKPLTIDLKKRIQRFPPNFEFNIDYAYWLINEILVKTSYKLESEESDIWIPLCSEILKNHPYSYRKHLRYLCENFSGIGNILWRGDYSKGKCYSYRLAPYYFKDAIDIFAIYDAKLLKYLSKRAGVKSNNAFKKQYNFLAKYFCTKRLKIDVRGCNELNKVLYTHDYDYRKHLYNGISLTQVANEEFNLKLSENDGRVHTQLTRLPKPFRKFLTYDGKKLGEVDISASVPTFLLFILLNWNKENSHIDKIINTNKIYYRHYMFLKTLLSIDNIELSSFKRKLLTDQLYDSFIEGMHTIHHFDMSLKENQYFIDNVAKIFNRDFDGDLADLRAVVKKNFLSMLNAKYYQYINEQAEFNKHFPSILKWVKYFKKPNHKYFSYLTLQSESYFMLNIVARQLNNKHSGKIPLLTLHDCLITTEDNLEYLYEFMEKTLTENLGFTPNMKVKLYQ